MTLFHDANPSKRFETPKMAKKLLQFMNLQPTASEIYESTNSFKQAD